ncbi:carboxypeptidase regulatory-like domain-containing protein [bacterium]|uniref:Carboxypeptidase regulatory-like domain-containing protein n=1 Tax=Rubinisphaera brasiliensis (strain ATCC 49424 / DSM 5305 / JCM 21570 / IAM 15109 / NBRC 103401 / IFAM 1448) TaxID=756272 RepID=F0SGH4_RUBBR|nr:carboxypeptidase regulatory-like domain-containing protein [Rubinisphaera brasiliensis]ADY60573.1 hypothetical protein Plabr_2975 [Rubinisphaera brasiliensis DSM 5305]MBR9802572.1 carboxypeptidase regulatory-like domain-containing protein [bacterium]
MTQTPFWGTGQFFLILLLTVAGCGKSAEVAGPEATGYVTLDGSPLTNGDLSFYPIGEGSSAQAALDGDGRFRVNTAASATGIAPGEYKVTVESWADAEGDEENEGEPISLIPNKYTKERTTDLRITVTEEGPNDFHLELTSEK